MRTHTLTATAALAFTVLLLIPSAAASEPLSGPVSPPVPATGRPMPHSVDVAANSENSYVPITSCRVVDTRTSNKPNLSPGALRSFSIAGTCGIPAAATAVATNTTVINPSGAGYLRAWAVGKPESNTILNFARGQSLTSAPILPLGTGGAIWVREAGSSSDFAIDVVGYDIPPLAGTFTDTGDLYAGSGRLVGNAHPGEGYFWVVADRDLTGCVRDCLRNGVSGPTR